MFWVFLLSKHALVENPMNGLMNHYMYPADSRAVCLQIFGWGCIIFYYFNQTVECFLKISCLASSPYDHGLFSTFAYTK